MVAGLVVLTVLAIPVLQLHLGQNVWKVVGIFTSNGSISESELWADAEVLAPAYRRGISFQSAVVKLASPGSFQQFKDALTSDPRVSLRIERETDYYAGQSRTLTAGSMRPVASRAGSWRRDCKP